MDVMALHLDSIRMDPLLQPRVRVDQGVVSEYAEAMEAGDQFPPVVVFDDSTTMWLADGWHRIEAARTIRGTTQIQAEIHQGTRRDALLYSLSANAQHGLRRTALDKRRSVARLLQDPEWTTWSDREIARVCRVSPTFVGSTRKIVTVHVDSERTYTTKHGTVATMNTAPIAAAAEARAAESVRTEEREVKPYPGLNNDVCEADRKLLAEAEEQRASMRRVETFADNTFTVAWVPTAAEAEESEIPTKPKPSILGPRDGGVDGWTAEYGMAPDRLAPIWRLEQAIEQYLDARHGIRGMNDQNPDVRLATVSAIVADDFGEEFDEFEPYIEQPYRQGDLRQALNNVAEQLRQAIARMEAKPQNPWAPALTPRPREAREVDAEMAPWLITFERDTDSVLRAQVHAVRNPDHITRDLMPVPVDSMTIGATIANKHAALRALLAVGGQVDAAQLDVGMRVTWPGKEGELVRWDAGGRIAVVCDQQGIEYRIPRFMVDVHDHEEPGV